MGDREERQVGNLSYGASCQLAATTDARADWKTDPTAHLGA